jgi:hypothetical protein
MGLVGWTFPALCAGQHTDCSFEDLTDLGIQSRDGQGLRAQVLETPEGPGAGTTVNLA